MKQEDKNLLLKDLCSRLNTKLVCSIYRTDDEGIGYRDEILHGYCKGDTWYEFYFREDCSIGIDNVLKIKPYLLPLSSMTEKQCYELSSIRSSFQDCWKYIKTPIPLSICNFEQIEWFHKNHFDYRGLIEKDLAIDATGLNIY